MGDVTVWLSSMAGTYGQVVFDNEPLSASDTQRHTVICVVIPVDHLCVYIGESIKHS